MYGKFPHKTPSLHTCGSIFVPTMLVMPFRVLTGAQSGSERGVLDAAEYTGVGLGGYCSSSASDKWLQKRYLLRQLPTKSTAQCVKRNVHVSDATVIFLFGAPTALDVETMATAKSSWRVASKSLCASTKWTRCM